MSRDTLGVQAERRLRQAWDAYGAGRAAEAERLCRRVVERSPAQPDALHLLGLIAGAKGDLDRATDLLRRALRQRPDDPVCLNNLGNLLHEAGDSAGAVQCYESALEHDPGYVSALFNLGVALQRTGTLVRDALPIFQRLVELVPEDPLAWNRLGTALVDAGRVDEAIDAHRRAIALDPANADAHNNLGLAHAERGEFDEARGCYRRALEFEPGHAQAAKNLASAQRFHTGDEADLRLIEAAIEGAGIVAEDRGELHYALGKAYDDCGRDEAAFRNFEAANRLRRPRATYRPGAVTEEVSGIIEACGPEFFERTAGWGADSELPVFVVGMPRSGTTLVEQIIAAHPRAHGAGELIEMNALVDELARRVGAPAGDPGAVSRLDANLTRELAGWYVDRLRERAPGAARITDKLPGNYLRIGLIAALLPRARIVLCNRHPMDVGLSIYFTDLVYGHDYACDLASIGHQFREFSRLMAHWRAVLPVPVHEVSYERLVAEPEPVARELIAHCGLDWDDACLRFQETSRPIHTASVWQVRQPIYRSSVGRWRRYADHLGPLSAALGPLAGPDD